MLSIRFPVPRFCSAGEIFLDKGSLGVLRAVRATRAFVLVSGSLWRIEAARALIERALTGTEHIVVPRSGGEPTLGGLGDALAQLSDFAPDWIIAIGGGSVLDAAKLLWAFYEHPDLDLERALRPFGLPALRGKARFIAVPTTAGTGSEVSSSAAFIDEASAAKRLFVSHELLPDIAILDPALAAFTPPRQTAIAGLDALSHAVEGYVSRLQNSFLDLQAETAARAILGWLQRSVENPDDLAARAALQNAAVLAGWVQNTKVPGVGHAIAHQLGSLGVPHGLACGILLPATIRLNAQAPASRAKYRALASALGLADEDALRERLEHLPAQLGLPNRLRDASAAAVRLPDDAVLRERVVEGALHDICANVNPTSLNADLVRSTMLTVI